MWTGTGHECVNASSLFSADVLKSTAKTRRTPAAEGQEPLHVSVSLAELHFSLICLSPKASFCLRRVSDYVPVELCPEPTLSYLFLLSCAPTRFLLLYRKALRIWGTLPTSSPHHVTRRWMRFHPSLRISQKRKEGKQIELNGKVCCFVGEIKP